MCIFTAALVEQSPLRELGVDPPIACLVGVCQRGAVHCSRKPMW